MRGLLPADNPDYTDRQKQYNPSFFIPKSPFSVFVVNNAKSINMKYIHNYGAMNRTKRICSLACQIMLIS
ncbi:conserved hypothetical protein [Aeromonas salmonicida]|nr:conserved hypothetical protein [Aeromonas salmonicida]